MRWYDGLTDVEIAEHLRSGTAPNSNVAGGWIEVPNGFIARQTFRHGKPIDREIVLCELIDGDTRRGVYVNMVTPAKFDPKAPDSSANVTLQSHESMMLTEIWRKIERVEQTLARAVEHARVGATGTKGDA